ncbi:iron-sulfur cluster assembly protein [Haloarcula nitratireducens]|uniref:Iron-sulfur cluster assembly protein n=1 Tax=Haloarcula nitratireducens TaxID=2487749 RepID=A0AAW4PIQ4_9EURY|nr:iron-sulfur cluster assembly protein [Halomicroarcula nitratireducens]MBX0298007.1 iron-sulfur cluster assembly protein [Halomicroarcula nitratireducens]
MSSRTHTDAHPTVREIRNQLDQVTDPELDESIVELDYIDDITIQGSLVDVTFSLPTAWCSPAFAWMMATDARDEVESLDSVERATISLREHMHETEITEGVNGRKSFENVFPDADGGIESIRASLDDKARVGRQYDAMNELLDVGLSATQIVQLTRGNLSLGDDGDTEAVIYVRDGAVAIPVDGKVLASYVEKAKASGVFSAEDDLLFRTPEGEPIDPDQFDLIHKRTRLAKVNMSGQGNICDALNEARFDPDRPDSYAR